MQLAKIFTNLLLLPVATLPLLVAGESTEPFHVSDKKRVEPVTTDLESFTSLVARDDCSTVNAVIEKIGPSTEIATYFSTGYYSTLWVCQRMRGTDCADLAMAVASTIVSIIFIVGRTLGSVTWYELGVGRCLWWYVWFLVEKIGYSTTT